MQFERGGLPDHIGPLLPVTHIVLHAGEYIVTPAQLDALREKPSDDEVAE